MQEAEKQLQEALDGYDFGGLTVGAVRYGEGHINDTFCVYVQDNDGECVRYIMQRINTNVFTDPKGLMENICGVTDYLRTSIEKAGGDSARGTMTVLRTREAKPYFTDSKGGAWRVYPFVEGTICLQSAKTPELFHASAKAFGNFQHELREYPASSLHETIAKFHDTKNRYANFIKALESDTRSRAASAKAEIDFVLARKDDCAVLVDMLAKGELPLRVTHNDTKLNNVLIDKASGEGICVIDLDTVMPGLALNDFGDSIRFGANHSAEDEQDLSKVNFDIALYETYVDGFLSGCAGALGAKELEYLPWGARLMTLECGIRFLTDYLEGDTYFKIHRDGQNLDRCRTQFKLVSDMEKCFDEMSGIISRHM